MSETFAPLDYVMQYGGRCRGCADHDGICPGDFMPCDSGTKRSAVAWVIGALEYGRRHGYIADETPPALPELVGAARAVIDRWDTPVWKQVEPTGLAISRLRDALAALSPDTGSREG